MAFSRIKEEWPASRSITITTVITPGSSKSIMKDFNVVHVKRTTHNSGSDNKKILIVPAKRKEDYVATQKIETCVEEIIFEVNKRQFTANRAQLSKKSPIFEAQFQSANFYTIKNLDSEDFEALLDFILKGKISNDVLRRSVTGLLAASDQFHITDLKKLCEDHLIETLSTNSAVNFLVLADNYNARRLKTKAMEYINQHREIHALKEFRNFFENSILAMELLRAMRNSKTDTTSQPSKLNKSKSFDSSEQKISSLFDTKETGTQT